MKESEAKNPVFTQAWWKKNKASTLKSTGFGKKLKEYEDACKGRKDSALIPIGRSCWPLRA